PIAPWDHDNDGIRDDMDDDDDYDGMKDEDEVMLWPSRYGSESTNPWDHDDFGGGVGLADPTNNSTGPDYFDVDDDNDGREDADWNNPSSGDWPTPANKIEESSGLSSDWDSDNDGLLDHDDKIPTRITLNTQSVLWLDETTPAIFNGSVFWLDDTGFVPAPDLPVQVHIRYTENGTSVIETIDVLTNANGEYVVGQFLFPEDIDVGSNTTYEVYSEVTEMFIHDYSSTLSDSNGDGIGDSGFPVEVRANTTIGFVAGQRFRADEQPLKLDFKVHYTADYNRGIFDNRLAHAPVSFTISDPGTEFGNITHPTVYDGDGGGGYRADSGGWISLAYDQSTDFWEQVQWNSTLDNGPGIPTGGYEEIRWTQCQSNVGTEGYHSILGTYEYHNTTLPVGDYSFIGYARPDLGGCTDDPYEWPWAHLEGSKTDTFFIRAMHRMYIEADMFAPSFRPVYFWDATQFTGSSFGAWRALFHAPSLANSGTTFEEASLGKPYPILWDGTPAALSGIAAGALSPFLTANGTHWTITLQNGADFDSPPCGPVDPLVSSSEVRCEIVPEVFTGEKIRVKGHVWNRTIEPVYQINGNPISVALQFDFDRNGIFVGSTETQFSKWPTPVEGLATFDYEFTWESQWQAQTYGVRADFSQSDYFFTGDQDQVLAATGAYGNVSVIGTTEFTELSSLPRLYRGQNTSVQVRLVDNAYQPVREVPVNWTWSEDQSSGISITDNNGRFRVNLTDIENLGNFTLGFTYLGDERRQGNHAEVSLWVVSRTFINV
ncbi:MAG TPA: Ig-like domain-containing protein, partial [Candidatus Thalassarchaeaceae archaeon]|nr:Ig-like domain-containing protein [Candidatus Thalassarchaeaceae archaeon]